MWRESEGWGFLLSFLREDSLKFALDLFRKENPLYKYAVKGWEL